MRHQRHLAKWLVALGILHGVVGCAGFFAPYDPGEQSRDNAFAAPTRIHLVDSRGLFHFRPFFYESHVNDNSLEQIAEDATKSVPLQFFTTGARYRLLGLIPCRVHLFSAESGRVYLLGSDGYGRDQFSRILYGGQISLLAGLLGASLTLLIGLAIGTAAGFYGGWRDSLLMRLAELFAVLPWLYLLFALRAFLPLGVGALEAFFLVIVVIGTVGWA